MDTVKVSFLVLLAMVTVPPRDSSHARCTIAVDSVVSGIGWR